MAMALLPELLQPQSESEALDNSTHLQTYMSIVGNKQELQLSETKLEKSIELVCILFLPITGISLPHSSN
jgi:hypothetical protein